MPLFQYEARNAQGSVLKGKMEAGDAVAVTANLREKNYYPVSIKPYKKLGNIDLSDYQKVSLKDLSIFCKQFSVITSSGIVISRALQILKEQTENNRLRKILSDVSESIQKGKALSDSMGEYKEFPRIMIAMLEVGESSGNMDIIMERLSIYYEKEFKQQQKIKQALTYPAIICIFALVVVILLVVKILPIFLGVINQSGSNVPLPLPTVIVMAISNGLIKYWYIIILMIVSLVVLFKIFVASESGRKTVDSLSINLPILGKTNRKLISSRFARTFGTLMGSGMPIMNSIEICSNNVGNFVYKEILISLMDEVRKGGSLGDNLAAGGKFPVMLSQMIKVGEETGTLDLILDKTADFYDQEVESATAQLTAMIEPLIIIILAVVVGFIVLSIILPMFSMYNAVGA